MTIIEDQILNHISGEIGSDIYKGIKRGKGAGEEGVGWGQTVDSVRYFHFRSGNSFPRHIAYSNGTMNQHWW